MSNNRFTCNLKFELHTESQSKMTSNFEDIKQESDSESDNEIESSAAQGNSKARKPNNSKKVVGSKNQDNQTQLQDQTGKSRIQIKIIERLREDSFTLSLTGEKLQNLNDLQKMPTTMNEQLQKIDVSKNYLDNIDALNQLTRLKVIIASDNYIRSANLQLPKLQELDLRNNFIEKVPILSQMPQLKVLILNANNITELKLQCKDQNYLNIMKMVFRNNKIRFNNMEVINFVKKLKEFKALKVLSLDSNPFEQNQQIVNKIIRGLPKNLEIYNEQKRVYVQGTIANTPDDDPLSKQTPVGGEQEAGDEQKKTNVQVMPTLENLLYNLEAANSHPNQALRFLKLLYQDVEKITYVQEIQNDSVFLQSFTKAKDQHTIQENIETFMQHAQLLVDNHFELRSIILSILSKLTIIRCHDFGVKCFSTLRDLMVAGRELEVQVMEQLNENVIQSLTSPDQTEIPVSILIGLKDLVERQSTHQVDLMAKLFKDFFPNWLGKIKLQLASKSRGSQVREENSDQIDAILALLAASLRDDEINVNRMQTLQLHDIVAEIFLKTSPTKPRYLFLLDCMNQIAKMNSVAATYYIEKFIHREIMQEIKLTFFAYKKSQELYPVGNKDNIAQTVIMYKVFAAQIELIASLLNAKPQARNQVMQDNLIDELLQILTHNATDPILLTSICYLAEKILVIIREEKDVDMLVEKVNKMQSIEGLLPYLGLKKYKDLLKSTMKYNNMEDQGGYSENEGGSLEYNNDPIIHRLFIQIIKLITYFCKEQTNLEKMEKEIGATSGNQKTDYNLVKMKAVYEAVCTRLNDAMRETALFRCLEIPNDEVKLACVTCLLYVPIHEIDAEEIDQLLKLMNPQNIGAGKTELVLCVIFNIFNNLISDTSVKAQKTTGIFKQKFSYTAITLAINIMMKNQERQVDDENEELEKYSLSLSILNFLKRVSDEPQTKDQLCNKGDVLKRTLFAEQQYTKSIKFIMTAVEIETTQLGMDFDSLYNSVQPGFQCLKPYNFVSFRVLHQMANLLMKEKPLLNDSQSFQQNELDSDQLINAYQGSLMRKIKLENQFWRFEDSLQQSVDEKLDSAYDAEQKKHHKVFTKKNGVKGILHFLTSHSNSVENWLRQHSVPAISHAGEKEKHPIFGQGLKYKIMKLREKLQPKEVQEEFKGKQIKKKAKTSAHSTTKKTNEESKEKKGSMNGMLNSFRDSELGLGYVITDTDHYLASQKSTVMVNRLRKREVMEMSINDPEQRSLSIAAFLRCLYASIDSAPHGDYYELAIENLQNEKVFTQLTQLCASTGWLTANIGTKYLQVMHYIIRVDSTKRLEDQKNLIKYEILSIVIKQILGLLKEKIKNENHNMELDENDINLLCHLTVVCNQIVSQCTLFDFCRRDKENPYEFREHEEDRSLRFNLIDFMMSKLFPLDMVQILIDVVFQEMKTAQTRLHGSVNDEYSRQSGNKTLEHAKKFLAMYLAFCEKNKFETMRYLMHNIVFVGKSIRIGFLEEILEETNQLQVSNHHIQIMTAQDYNNQKDETYKSHKEACATLAYKNKNDLDNWMKEFQNKQTETLVNKKKAAYEAIRIDCSLGERVLFCQPMNVHIRYAQHDSGKRRIMQTYEVFTVILTNQGVYIFDDRKQSADQDPEKRSKLKMPEQIERFNYSTINRVSYAEKIAQRIVINVCKEKEALPNQLLNLHEGVYFDQDDTPDLGQTMNGTTMGNSKSNHTNIAVKNKRQKVVQKEEMIVTFVVPNDIDSKQMRIIFEEVLVQQQSETDLGEDFDRKPKEDHLVKYLILEAINKHKASITKDNANGEKPKINRGKCPFCKGNLSGKDRVCVCNYHLVYAYKMTDERRQPQSATNSKQRGDTDEKEKPLQLVCKSKQRGGPARLLSTPLSWHAETRIQKGREKPKFFRLRDGFEEKLPKEDLDKMQPRFGILAISTTDIYFLEEDPNYWRDYTDKESSDFKQLFDEEVGNSKTDKGKQPVRQPQDKNEAEKMDKNVIKMIREPKNEQRMDPELKKDDWFALKEMEKMKVINGRVPAIEIHHKRQNAKGEAKKEFFSLMSDYNMQETIFQLKQLKKSAKRDDDSD